MDISSNKFPPITTENPLILASASPRRKRLLEQIRLPFVIMPSNADENHVDGGPSVIACHHAGKKARVIRSQVPSQWILGADTIVVLGDKILGKPKDHDDARSMLRFLSGKEHEVITGFCIIDPSGAIRHCESVSTLVRIKDLTEDEIIIYIETSEPFGKAGSYAIQGIGSFMVESISGDYSNVVGLPVCSVIKALLELGALDHFPVR
ncbi:MAG: septum formation protein Maf [Deltaproteobacteria bacterium]|nr:septum formation protein Maf [Deltaproteobacteria bacterium]